MSSYLRYNIYLKYLKKEKGCSQHYKVIYWDILSRIQFIIFLLNFTLLLTCRMHNFEYSNEYCYVVEKYFVSDIL
ncbi:hypothetical protein V1478_016757 [Vespula squamosa]|uniref:Uncharacterized protein n=1 Tax=Vespula squamosa TaxID=30214 RepID=A0ABD2A3C9_VESSQ